MAKNIILETKELKQYFPLNSTRNEKQKLNSLKMDILSLFAEEGKSELKFKDIVKTYNANNEEPNFTKTAKLLLEEYNLIKSLHGQRHNVKANDGITMHVYEGETVGIVGESGCGKSTYGRSLLKLYKPTSGEIYFEGNLVKASSIRDTEALGIVIIHQELALVKEMSVLENIFLGNELGSFARLNDAVWDLGSAWMVWDQSVNTSFQAAVACTVIRPNPTMMTVPAIVL